MVIISLYHGAYISEVVRSGIESVSRGQYEAAEFQGFTFVQTIIYIILPQTIKLVIPQLLQTIITIFKLPDVEKEIALFTVGDYDAKDLVNLEVAYINKDQDGYDYIEEIEDENVLKSAMKVVKKIIQTMD